MIKTNLISFILLLFFCSTKVSGQKEGNFWYFGKHAGIDFNSGSAVVVTDGAMSTDEGCAGISDSEGNLLFYTDGITIWNKLHLAMPNGTGLMGDTSSTQSSIIVPKPGSSTIYYVFTTTYQGMPAGLRYSEVDLSLDGGLGDVTTSKNIFLATPVTEKLTAVKNSNNVDFWVIAQRNAGYGWFFSFAVTSAGVTTTPVVSVTGTIDTTMFGLGYLKSSTDGTKLVAAIDRMNKVDILNFNAATGDISLDFSFISPFTGPFNPYGVEFSPDGSRLYLAGEASPDIYQYDMTLGSSTAILASATRIGTSSSPQLGALQNAPDGRMYFAKHNKLSLGYISNPNALGLACGFVDDGIFLSGKLSTFGLPNFIQSYFSTHFHYVNSCAGDTTFFSLTDSMAVDSVHWNFGDPASGVYNTSDADSSIHIFSAPGNYQVSVITYLGSLADTSTSIVSITGIPAGFVTHDTSACAGDSILLDAGIGYSYLWQDGSMGRTFTAGSPGNYYVTVINMCGSTNDTIHIAIIPLPALAVSNDTICAGQSATLTASGAGSYTWPTGIIASDSSASVNPPFTSSYMITGSNTGCAIIDTVIATVIVNPLPVPSFTASVNSGCSPLCVQFSETSSTSCASQVYLFGNGDSTRSSSPVYCYQGPGTYSVSIFCTDNSGCSGTTTVTNMIEVYPSPVADFSVNPAGNATTGQPVVFSTTQSGDITVIWDFGDPASGDYNSSVLFSTAHRYSFTGLYCTKLIATTTQGCNDTASECIHITGDIIIPNIFTPNGDHVNDEFYIKNLAPGAASLNVFDRWGKLIYSSSSYTNDWNGAETTDGVYYYVVDYPLTGKIYTGFVQILHTQ